MLNVRLCGGIEVEIDGQLLPDALIGGRQGRLVLAYLVCERDRAVRREELAELLWGEQLPDSSAASLSAVISRLRRLFTEAGLDGPAVVASTPGAYQLHLPAETHIDLEELIAAVAEAEDTGDLEQAARAEAIAGRGFLGDDCEWVDTRRLAIRDLRVRAAIAESAAHLGARATARGIASARRAVELDPGKEAAYRQLMSALAAAGERAEALRVWERCRITLVEELGIDPSPETEAVYLQLLDTTPTPPVTTELPSGVVTFLLTDIVESTSLWDEHPTAMAKALERHDTVVGQVVAAHGGTLLKSKLEGDATVSVFGRATAAATAALALQNALASEPWPEGAAPRVRMAMHTGEAFERGGDYFGPALNRAARLRSLAGPDEVLLSQAVTELVRDHLPDDVVLRDRGHRNLRGLSRGENVFQLVRSAAGASASAAEPASSEIERPPVPSVLAGAGPFVGRQRELEDLVGLWERACAGESGAVFIGGEPGVGKSRLAGEIAQRAYAAGGLVLYGRCDEDLSAPLQPFIEAVRVLAPALGATRLRAVRGVDELTRVIPALSELLNDEAPTVRADPDTERLALFDAVAQLLAAASSEAPVLLVLDDLHWAGKTTLSLVRHLLRGAKDTRLLVVGTYRDTELARTHPLAATLADLRRDTDTRRLTLSGLEVADVEAYLAAIGNTDRALGRELAEVTSGNPFFLIEVVRHVDESGGSWQPGTLPEGVRDATGRRLSRLSDAANAALSVAAIVGTTFDLDIVEQVVGGELVDPIAEACQAGLVVEESGSLSRFRFAHALVRQVLLAELVTLKRVRVHRTIAELLEAAPVADPDARLADLAYHWFESASAGGADRAVTACHRAADRAMERLAYEEAGDLYGMALQALEWVDKADDETSATLHLARCDALLTSGDVAGARDAIDALELAAAGSERLAAWYTTYEGLLAVLGEPDRLGEIVQSIGAAAGAMRAVGDLTGEAKAHHVHASALERLGQIGAAERALDAALAAARSAGDRRLADAILAEAPPAALWGPSPVTRASGRCLDVVRVLRITSGAPAVEAVSLRCQAVLEALRGRMDAARRMIRSSHRTVERLGLTHRRLEAELAAGLIELLDGQAVAAETHLRVAYEELRARGLGGETAQAGAFLGRALLLQDRVDEADDFAAAAEALAGSDLKAAIAWRDVRAEVAVRRGDTARALALAREAVALASATDALLLVADARLALATVLRATGDDTAADAEAQRAVEACEAKGATVLAERARVAMRTQTPAPAAEPAPRVRSRDETDNLAFAAQLRAMDAFNRGDWDAVRANRTPDLILDDRRNHLAMTVATGTLVPHEQVIYENGGRLDPPALVATRGQHAALTRCLMRAPEWEYPYLAVVQADELGRTARYVMFDSEAIADAYAVLEAAAGESAMENDATRAIARMQAALLAQDWDALMATTSAESTTDDRRSFVGGLLDHEQWLAASRMVFDARITHDFTMIATRGRSLALARWILRVPSPEANATVLTVIRTDEQGRHLRSTQFDEDDLERAIADLDAQYRATQQPLENDATRYLTRILAAWHAGDWDQIVDCYAPEATMDDRRSVVAASFDPEQFMAMSRLVFDGAGTHECTTIATRGRSLALAEWRLHIPEPEASAKVLMLVRADAEGRHLWSIQFDPDDLEAALAELDARYVQDQARLENDATRNLARTHDAYKAHDWDAVAAGYADDYTTDDRRSVVAMPLDHEQSMASVRWIFDGDCVYETREIVATRGRDLAVARSTLRVFEPEAIVTTLSVTQVNDEGRFTLSIIFDPDDVEGALVELDALYLVEEKPAENDATRTIARVHAAYDARDWDVIAASYADGYVQDDRRSLVAVSLDHEQSRANSRWIFDGRGTFEGETIATRGRNLVLTRTTLRIPDPEARVTVLVLAQVDEEGRQVRSIFFDADDVEAAMAELDALHRAEAHAVENEASRAVLRVSDAANRRDWQGLLDGHDPSFVTVEHRQAVRLRLEGDDALSTYRIMFTIDDCRLDRTVLATRGERLALLRDTASFSDGLAGPSEVIVLAIIECGADGRVLSNVTFDADDVEGAKAELDARYRSETNLFENAAWRAALRVRDASNNRDWEDFLDALDPAFVSDSHRHAVLLHLEGDNALDAQRAMFALDKFRFDRTLLATRGERLALTTDTVVFTDGLAGPSEVVTICLLECDAAGLIRHFTAFNPDDLGAAYDALNVRYIELGGGPYSASLSKAFDARDWDAFASAFHPECTIGDFRTAGWGLIDRDTFVEYQRSVVELAPDAHMWNDHLRSRGNAVISTGRAFGTHDGGPWEIAYVTVGVVHPDGRLQYAEVYDFSDTAVALARFDEFVAADEQPEPNRAWSALDQERRALERRDWSAVVAGRHPEMVFDDRRRGIAASFVGEEAIAVARVLFDMDHATWTLRLLATAGDQLALTESHVTGTDGAAGDIEVRSLGVTEVDHDGRICRNTVFDAEDIELARAEMHARAAALEAS